jgi:hypothetical protein
LFYLPVTKAWLQQVMLGLVLLCHSSFQGVVEFFRDVLDCPVALGSVHNSLMQAVAQARQLNAVEELSAVRAAGHDGIFQSGQKVAVGVELDLHVIDTDDPPFSGFELVSASHIDPVGHKAPQYRLL